MVNPESVLVDLIALSKGSCSHPIEGRLAYATGENFLGRVVEGYHPEALEVCLLTRKAAQQLCLLQNKLIEMGLSLFIFDAFRPLRAVRDFSAWFRVPSSSVYEKERKQVHYPHLEKEDLPRLGYAPDTVSRHCFGHAVDISLRYLESGKWLNMGTEFDYFDSSSHLDALPEVIGEEAVSNRQFLIQLMEQFGFLSYPFEWWHFEYREQEVEQPMDMEIIPSLQGLGVI